MTPFRQLLDQFEESAKTRSHRPVLVRPLPRCSGVTCRRSPGCSGRVSSAAAWWSPPPVKVRSGAIAWLEEHVRYETVEPYPLVEEWADGADPETDPSVLLVGSKKMRYPKISDPDIGEKNADKASGIVNDPNQWGLERGEPRYILDLVKRVVTVSLRTVEIVESLPRLTF